MGYVETLQGRLEFEDSGGDGPPVILTPDAGADHTVFAPQVAALSDVYRLLTWDQDVATEDASEHEETRVKIAVEAVFSLLDAVGVERAVLGGVGEGASLSLRAALRQPDRVRALVLVDLPHRPASDDDLDDRLPELAMPILLVSRDDIAEYGTWLRLVADRVDDCRGVVELPGGAGPTNLSCADEVNEAVRAFLESLPA